MTIGRKICENYLLDQLVQGLGRSVEEEIAGPLVPVVRGLPDQNRIDRLISRFGVHLLGAIINFSYGPGKYSRMINMKTLVLLV